MPSRVTSSVIAIVSGNLREAAALAGLIGAADHAASVCASIRQFKGLLRKVPPAVVLTRARLVDGYSDDVLALLGKSGLLPGTAVIVLATADYTSKQEARQLNLGADCVLKDPLRPDVLMEYAIKFLRAPRKSPTSPASSQQFPFAGAIVRPDERQLQLGKKSVRLSPKEIELARLLGEFPGQTVTYEVLYSELFGRPFSGDSANGRVLLGKLASSFQRLRIDLREQVQVIPKLGYRYLPSRLD
jgi:DNA-binding response OmpR family regulator